MTRPVAAIDTTTRAAPHDLDAEAAVLATVLLEAGSVDKISDALRPEQFYSEANRRIYEAVVTLATEGTPVDIVSVGSRLRADDRLAQVGGSAYLAQLVDAVPATSHVEAYAKTVAELWRLRQLIRACETVKAEAYGPVTDIQGFIDSAEQTVYSLARSSERTASRRAGEVIYGVFEEIRKAAERGQSLTGIPTGFERLDAMTAGLHDGDLTIVAARPGMGKTGLAMNIAANVVAPNSGRSCQYGAAVFSLEMPREQLATRMVCAEGRVDIGKMRQGALHERDWDSLTRAASFLYQLPLWINDTPAVGVMGLRAEVRRLQAEFDEKDASGNHVKRVGVVIVDYLQLMSGSGNAASREQEISEISRGLKQLAKELRVPVIALSQLNRSVETRGKSDKRPQLSDLRESGAIEQDADNVIFIYRDDYYSDESECSGIAELIVAKQRNGPTGKVKIRFERAFTRFDNLAPGEHEGDE